MIDPDPPRIDSLHRLMQDYVDTGKSAGMSTLVCQRGELIHFSSYGHADIDSATPVRPDTIFRIYSMTKPITSVALLQLMEHGHFDLDDAAKRWIPRLGELEVYQQGKLESDITIRQLLTHTAGFSYGFDPENIPVDELYAEVWRGGIHDKTLEELLHRLLDFPLIAQPGTRWHYSVATDICGYLVEVISGKPFGDYLQEHILEPLGMQDTAFEIAPDKVERLATLYGYSEADALAPLETRERSPLIPSISGVPVRLHSGGGGLLSTAPDYLRFAQAMLNRGELDGYRLLEPETVALMTRNQLPRELLPLTFNGIAAGDYRGYGFGLGYCINLDPAQTAAAGSHGDFGWGGMADTYCWIDPAQELVAILMQQYLPSLFHPGRKDFRDAVYAAIELLRQDEARD